MRFIIALLLSFTLCVPVLSCSKTDTTGDTSVVNKEETHTQIINLSYAILSTLGETYDFAMKAVADGQSKGKITSEQRERINKVAQVYYDSYQAAVSLLTVYKDTVIRLGDVPETVSLNIQLLAVMSGAMTHLSTLVKEVKALNLSIGNL